MNISDNSAVRQCTSCQMCAAVCGRNAVKIELDADGFYRPVIDTDACSQCGLCVKVCYKFDKDIAVYGTDKLEKTILYGASAKNKEVLRNTTSGGIADLLAHLLVSNGYKCVGVEYDAELDRAVDRVATTESDVNRFRGSKYIQSYTLNAFKAIVQTGRNEKYAVFGTPCHIYALDRYLRLREARENFILIDLYCHGCPSMNVWKKYLKDVKQNVKETRIDNANFRSKRYGWGSFYVVVVVDGKPVYYSSKKRDDFFDLFFCDQILNEACNNCKLRSTLEYTDIRLGDFWGKQYVLDTCGVSAVSLASDRGKNLFSLIADEINYREEKYDDFLPWQSWGKEYTPDDDLRRRLLEQLRDEKISLDESIKTIYENKNLKDRLIYHVKKLTHGMPLWIEKRIRWVFYKIASRV